MEYGKLILINDKVCKYIIYKTDDKKHLVQRISKNHLGKKEYLELTRLEFNAAILEDIEMYLR